MKGRLSFLPSIDNPAKYWALIVLVLILVGTIADLYVKLKTKDAEIHKLIEKDVDNQKHIKGLTKDREELSISLRAKGEENGTLKTENAQFKIEKFSLKKENDELKLRYDNLVSTFEGELMEANNKLTTNDITIHHISRLNSGLSIDIAVIRQVMLDLKKEICILKTQKWDLRTLYEKLSASIVSLSIEKANMESESKIGRLQSASM